jgi:hypothetical protein
MSSSYSIKAKVRTNKLDHNPLFIRFLNWKGDRLHIENTLLDLKEKFQDEKDKAIVALRLADLSNEYLNNLSDFQKKFRAYVITAINSQDISEEFLMWLNNAFKYIEESVETYVQDEMHQVQIKDPEGRWFEALLCYNFIMTINFFGSEILKLCPVCSSFFSHKGKYARYCSEACKSTGMGKK